MPKKRSRQGRIVIKKYKGEFSKEDAVLQLIKLWMSHIKMKPKVQE